MKYLEWIAHQFKIEYPSMWHDVKMTDMDLRGGKYFLDTYYMGLVSTALVTLYPGDFYIFLKRDIEI
jgi:hypothetical protein